MLPGRGASVAWNRLRSGAQCAVFGLVWSGGRGFRGSSRGSLAALPRRRRTFHMLRCQRPRVGLLAVWRARIGCACTTARPSGRSGRSREAPRNGLGARCSRAAVRPSVGIGFDRGLDAAPLGSFGVAGAGFAARLGARSARDRGAVAPFTRFVVNDPGWGCLRASLSRREVAPAGRTCRHITTRCHGPRVGLFGLLARSGCSASQHETPNHLQHHHARYRTGHFE